MSDTVSTMQRPPDDIILDVVSGRRGDIYKAVHCSAFAFAVALLYQKGVVFHIF